MVNIVTIALERIKKSTISQNQLLLLDIFSTLILFYNIYGTNIASSVQL
jgi:hypothetical protein